MTLALRYAVRSDVGLLREGNEDSAYAGPHLLAVADGMGGHAAGEVASAATITTISSLDSARLGGDLIDALADAVASANLRLQELIVSDPSIEGMGTTLTALLWLDGHAALCHIGDSRAYLLRGGQFYQITHDHTLVQSLVDEGKITEDDVATHPHRSLLLRALDGRTMAEPDLSTLETLPGDRYLLCSDGLSGVVTEQTLHQTLNSVWEPEKATLQLIELAIRGGGPDNITCIVADVVDTAATPLPPTRVPVLAGAAAHGTDPRSPARESSPATRAMRLTRTTPQPALPDEPVTGIWGNGHGAAAGLAGVNGLGGPGRLGGSPGLDEESDERGGRRTKRGKHGQPDTRGAGDEYADGDGDDDDFYGERVRRRRWPVLTTMLVLLILLIGGGAYGGWQYVQSQYYIGVQDGNVAIFRGINQNLLGVSMSTLVQRTDLPVAQVVASSKSMLVQTVSASSLNAAKSTVSGIQATVSDCRSKWQALANWQAANIRYQADLARARHNKKYKVPRQDNPGAQPASPDLTVCAVSTAFGIQPGALPGGTGSTTGTGTSQPGGHPTSHPTPSASKSTHPTARPTAHSASPTAKATA